MTDIVKQLYKGAKKNNGFIDDAYMADGDTPPKMFSTDLEKISYAMIYYGWLIGKYGTEWRKHI